MAAGRCEHYTWQGFLNLALDGASDLSDEHRSSRREHASRFVSTTWDEAVQLAQTGWRGEALDEARRFAQRVAAQVVTERLATTFEPFRDVTGSQIDIATFLAGEPECMIEAAPIRHASRGRAVRIAVPVGYLADVDASLVLQRGAAVMALIEALAIAQHPLEVWATSRRTSKSGKASTACAVLVQPANAPMDAGRVMFALAHPAMLRRLIFSALECQGAGFRRSFEVKPNGGYSGSRATRADDLPELPGGTSIVLPLLVSGADWGEAAAIRWVESTLTQIMEGT